MLYSIQFLRGIAALLVVMAHTAHKGNIYNTETLSWFHIGGSGVDLFFIISGFIMCYTTHNKNLTIISFLTLRVQRIIPLYWVFTTLALTVFVISPSLVNSSGGETSIIDSYFLIPSGAKYLVNNGWTLSYEFYYYLIFSLFLVAFSSTKLRYACIIATLLILSSFGLMFQPEDIVVDFLLSSWLYEFAIGVILFVAYDRGLVKANFGYISVTLALAFLLYKNFNMEYLSGAPRVISIGVPMGLLFYGFLSFEGYFKRKKHFISNLFERIGDSSYSLYLSHPFVLSPMAIIASKLGVTNSFLFGVILIGSSVFIGYATYVIIEKRIIYFTKIKLVMPSVG